MSKRTKLAAISAGAVLLYFLSLHVWVSASYSGRIEGVHGEPIEGAAVAVVWIFKSFGRESALLAKQSTTNKEGEFEIEGWLRWSPYIFAYMPSGPIIYVARRGYHPFYMAMTGSERRAHSTATPKGVAQFQLKPIDGNDASEDLSRFTINMCNVGYKPDSTMVWKDAKLFVLEVEALEKSMPKVTHKISDCVRFEREGI